VPLLAAWLAAWALVLTARYGDLPVAAPRWRVAAEGRGQPAVIADTAWFLTRRHEVMAVNTVTGQVRWKTSTREPGDDTLGSTIVAVGDLLVVGDYFLFGLDGRTGRERWRFEPGEGYGPGVYVGDAGGGLIFAGSPAGRLYAVGLGAGKQQWSYVPVRTPKTTVFQPVVSDADVAAGYTTFGDVTTGGVFLLDRDTGRERWRREFPPATPGAPTGFGGGLVFCGPLLIVAGGDGRIQAFDRASGRTQWTLPAVVRADGRVQDRDWRALAVSGRTLIAGSVSGTVTAWDLNTIQVRWRVTHPDGGSVAGRMSADESTVYVPHLGGLLVAIDVRDGRPRWQAGGWADGFSWAPWLSGMHVYAVGSRSGLADLPR
jgi:outer membrane protein assembly factor BamB